MELTPEVEADLRRWAEGEHAALVSKRWAAEQIRMLLEEIDALRQTECARAPAGSLESSDGLIDEVLDIIDRVGSRP